MQTSPTIGAIAKALAVANTRIKNPNLDSVNPHFKNRYASLGAILNAIRLPFADQGLSLVQTISHDNGEVAVRSIVLHISGEWLAATVAHPMPDRATVQQLGSLVTYLRRYSAAAIAGIVGEEDDDGEGDRAQHTASKAANAAPAPSKAAPAPRPIKTAEAATEPAEAPTKAKSTKPADAYPDVYEGVVEFMKIVERPGKPIAIQVAGDHGSAWITTDVPEFIDRAKSSVEGNLRLMRENGTLTIVGWFLPDTVVPAPTTNLPF